MITKQISNEIEQYLFEDVEIGDDIRHSEYKLKKRINYFKNRWYVTGKVTESGEYEYWFDRIQFAVNHEVKNLRLDSKYFLVFSKNPIKDFPAVYIANVSLHEWMEETGRAEELSESVEDFSADGNILLKKTADGYKRCDMLNTFLTNTTARTVDDTAIIERFYMTQSDLRKKGVYDKDKVEMVIKECGNKFFHKTEKGIGENKSTPLYELYRRTGEVSEKDLREAQGKSGGKKDKYVLAMLVIAGLRKGKQGQEYVLFAEELDGKMSDYFKEAHRGPYKGRWWREGLVELLMDHQVRLNDITNQIARGLEWASKVIFSHTDIQTLQNVRTALDNGSLIKSADLRQVDVRSHGLDQLIADRNHTIEEMMAIANSFEVVTGEGLPSGTPFRLGALQNQSATKLFEFLRKKLAVPYRKAYKEFWLKEFVKDIKGKDIIRLTGDQQFIARFRRIAAESWFNKNLVLIGPHTPEMREQIINLKVAELEDKEPMLENSKEIWKEVLPRLFVTVIGEAYNTEERETVINLLQFETDPVRRAFLTDYIYSVSGIPIPPPVQQEVPQVGAGGQQQQNEGFNVSPEEEPVPAQV